MLLQAIPGHEISSYPQFSSVNPNFGSFRNFEAPNFSPCFFGNKSLDLLVSFRGKGRSAAMRRSSASSSAVMANSPGHEKMLVMESCWLCRLCISFVVTGSVGSGCPLLQVAQQKHLSCAQRAEGKRCLLYYRQPEGSSTFFLIGKATDRPVREIRRTSKSS